MKIVSSSSAHSTLWCIGASEGSAAHAPYCPCEPGKMRDTLPWLGRGEERIGEERGGETVCGGGKEEGRRGREGK
jgi:hypothetical protein